MCCLVSVASRVLMLVVGRVLFCVCCVSFDVCCILSVVCCAYCVFRWVFLCFVVC